jgi:hypothetical protein
MTVYVVTYGDYNAVDGVWADQDDAEAHAQKFRDRGEQAWVSSWILKEK